MANSTIDRSAAPDDGGTSPSRGALRASLLRSERGGAVLRILFGLIWAADATFKWLPGFIHGQTLPDELGKAVEVQTPVIHQWLDLWHGIGTNNPGAFAVGIAILETLVAVGLLLGAFSNVTFIGSAILSFGIWSGAEGFHLPWSKPGITDLGPSVAYIIASLALFFLAAGATWSVDDSFLRRRLGSTFTSPERRSALLG
jgi:uncharacterized membrane protein YphA (DoxX/SURF4 family)